MKVNIEIENYELFLKHMLQRKYRELGTRFLTKNYFDMDSGEIIQVNITIENETIVALTAYQDDDDIIKFPDIILERAMEDIESSLND